MRFPGRRSALDQLTFRRMPQFRPTVPQKRPNPFDFTGNLERAGRPLTFPYQEERMPQSFNWTCPFCGRHTTINDDRFSQSRHDFHLGNKYGDQSLNTWVISCPNDECRELT